jgi:hypothetical protein
MINFPYVSLPEHFTRLLVSNIHHSTYSNANLDLYLNENRELNIFFKKYFTDIDRDGFISKILSVTGWIGIRNRLAAVYLEYAITGFFPDVANLALINDLISLENKLRHYTSTGYSRSFLLGFYVKMSLIQNQKKENVDSYTPLIIKDEHLNYMKFSKTKSIRIDWLILQLVQFDFFLGQERMSSLLASGTSHEALFSMLLNNEQQLMMENCLRYGASINDTEFFLTNAEL